MSRELGKPDPVVWQGRTGNRPPYPDWKLDFVGQDEVTYFELTA
jgi:hypothetical protein